MIKLSKVKNIHTLLKVRRLYLDTFPDFERLPFWLLMYKSQMKDSDFYVISDDEAFVGLVNLAYYQDIVYVYYLAIDPAQQSKGYGSQILEKLKVNYPDRRLILDIEKVDEAAENYHQRFKRKQFYERNGFRNTTFEIKTEDVVYESLYSGALVHKDEYDSLFKSYLNRVFWHLFMEKELKA